MAITLNHTIVPVHDKEASAEFFAHMFGLKYEGALGHFAPVRVNETLTLDFDNWDRFEMHHYAFHVSDAEFDAIFGRIKDAGIPYGSGPFSQEDMQINTRRGGRGVYFKDPNGHVGASDPDLIGEQRQVKLHALHVHKAGAAHRVRWS